VRIFHDRVEAGRLLARVVAGMGLTRPVVLGIPRGGLVVAAEIARAAGAELDVVLARKLGAPMNPEAAIGAASESGEVFLNDIMVGTIGVPRSYLELERTRVLAEIHRRSALYRKVRPRASLRGRSVIVTDDGVATGATMQASLWTARQEEPLELIAALPVAPEDTLDKLAHYADQTICLCAPPDFQAVGQFYHRFEQTTDEEAIALLAAAIGTP
jgi:predicted phosphoribosyltransferase